MSPCKGRHHRIALFLVCWKNMSKSNFVFGPVPSRRLGLSLGVDIVPLKSCSLDCIYCQLGRSSDLTARRRSFVDIDEVVRQIAEKLTTGNKPDHITISGSGEPTLNTDLGTLIDKLRLITKIPIAIITNGTLLYEPAVRRDCAKADVVLPSLDAGDPETFAKINRPHTAVHFDAVVDGLIQFRMEYSGQIWLEVFIVEGINTSDAQLAGIHEIIGRIRPDKVQLNTAVRPTTEPGIRAAAPAFMAQIAKKIGFDAEVIADFPQDHAHKHRNVDSESVLEMLRRRPCSLADVSAGLATEPGQALAHLTTLIEQGLVTSDEKNGTVFFKVK
jgi:wyosine [tRNA(Phe)-imidazoG37] synthetase (radical SAM superfamily)